MFKNVFRHYSKLLRRKIPIQAFSDNSLKPLLLTDDQELHCVYIVNTCEYCLETLPRLHEQIEDAIDEAYQDKIDLRDQAEDGFKELIN